MRFEIKCTGNFRQEIELIGRVIGLAATSYNKPTYNALVLESNGLEASDGNKTVDIIVETDPDKEIDYPGILDLDILVIMDQQRYENNMVEIGERGTVVIDPDLTSYYAKLHQSHNVYELPALKLSKEFASIDDLSSIIMLGFLVNHLHFLKPNSITNALKSIIPLHLQEDYVKALSIGKEYNFPLIH